MGEREEYLNLNKTKVAATESVKSVSAAENKSLNDVADQLLSSALKSDQDTIALCWALICIGVLLLLCLLCVLLSKAVKYQQGVDDLVSMPSTQSELDSSIRLG